MNGIRIGARIGALALLFAVCVVPHLAAKHVLGRSGWPRRFLAAAARICGARVSVDGIPPRPHSLLVANHVTWLDILVLGGATGCAFVSKESLGHGFVHWLADQNHTIYVRREHRKGARGQAVAVAQALAGAQPVALFPEGTVGPGDHLLPFRSTLLEAVSVARDDVEVRPVALDYGAAATEISWAGKSGKANVLQVLGRNDTIPVTIRLLAPLERGLDRKQLAHAAREAIGQSLASPHRPPPLYARAK